MSKYGLCGKTLKHSYSKTIHNILGNTDYALMNMSEEDFYAFMKDRNFNGVNVTIPYKTAALKCCDILSEEAKEIGCVNTVINKNGVLYGYNTDIFGFKYMLERANIVVKSKKAAILGSGGTSLTASKALHDLGAKQILTVSRNGVINYENIYEHKDIDIIVNTTPVGMYPNNSKTLLDLSRFKNLSGVVDVIYNPLKTRLIHEANELKIPTASGLSMLVAQAVKADELFFSKNSENTISLIEKTLDACIKKVSNIVLIGMPGSGKTTIGKILSKKTGMEFIDSDNEIEKLSGKKIPDIILNDGEVAFRALETNTLTELTKKSGCIIATGGGAVLSPYNRYLLKQNGVCIYIKRDLENLSTAGRPLSSGGTEKLKELFNVRNPIYSALSDFEVHTQENTENCAIQILNWFEKGMKI